MNYGYYPAFIEYAGSGSSLSASTFEAVVCIEIAPEILDGGSQKLFVLNTGISTPLAPVERALARL